MKWCELREYKWNEYVTIAVNRNLSLRLVEHCSANAEVTGSNPVEAPKSFFFGLFRNCLNCDSLRWSHTHFITPMFQIASPRRQMYMIIPRTSCYSSILKKKTKKKQCLFNTWRSQYSVAWRNTYELFFSVSKGLRDMVTSSLTLN